MNIVGNLGVWVSHDEHGSIIAMGVTLDFVARTTLAENLFRELARDALPDEALRAGREEWWRWEELNLRHGAYETPALPLSYTAEPNCGAELQAGILP